MGWNAFAWARPTDAAVGGLIVLALGAVAVGCSFQPARRIRLALWSLVGAAALPILAALPIAPRWSIPIFRASAPARAEPRPAEGEPPRPAPRPFGGIAAEGSAARPIAEPRGAGPASAPAPAHARWEPPTPSAILAACYAAGASAMAGWWLLGQAAFARLVRAARPASGAAREMLREVAGAGADHIRLLESGRVASPCTNTWICPVILLPPDLADGRDPEALRYALAHEWSHVERGDARAWNLAALLGLALFYQPLFWWLRRRLRAAQDELADARAAAAGSAEDYAAFLVRIARSRQAGPPWPALGIGENRSELSRRVLMLVQPREPLESRCRPAWSLAAAAIVAVVVVAASGLRLDASAPAQEPPTPPETAKKVEGEMLHYKGVVKDKDTGAPIAGAEVTVRRSLPTSRSNRVLEETHHVTAADGSYAFTIPPEQVAERSLYIELDVAHPGHAPRMGFGYALGMIRKNETLGERPFFELIELRPAQAVFGKVETPDGKPAAGVDLLVYSQTDKLNPPDFEMGSFTRAATDAVGNFRIPIVTPGNGVFQILPKDYAPESHEVLDGRRGDLGTLRLKPGVRLAGRAVDVGGRPVARMFVQASRQGGPVAGLPVADAAERTAETDADGRFAFDPLPAGEYRIAPSGYDNRRQDGGDPEPRPIPGVFLPVKATLVEGESPAPLDLRQSPHVVLEGGWRNSHGRPTKGWEIDVWGKSGDEYWSGQALPGPDGRFSVNVPRGLGDVKLEVLTNEHTAVLLRIGKDDPLQDGHQNGLGTIDHDLKGIEIIRYASPTILIDARTKDGEQVAGFKAEVRYVDARGVSPLVFLEGGRRKTEAIQDEQNDGRYRTTSLLPDREVRVSVSAEGFKPAERTMTLAEGKTEEATFVLEPN